MDAKVETKIRAEITVANPEAQGKLAGSENFRCHPGVQ
jgi:hypothetical protein